MPHPHAIVDVVSRIDPPLQAPAATVLNATPGGLTIRFASGQTARLDPADPQSVAWAEILDDLRKLHAPVYVEVDPRTGAITRLLIPLTVTVSAVHPTAAGDVEAELEISHARHVVRPTNPDFKQIVAALQAAQRQGTPVIVTETEDDHEIIDVRSAPPAVGPALAPTTGPPTVNLALQAVTPQRAQQLFDLVSLKSCHPVTVPPPCIPFRYPDDGCWARAHEMCRLILGDGEEPAKVWIYGTLQVQTRNHPNCYVCWKWHVAPTLNVTEGGVTRLYVLDPALFAEPVLEAIWKGVQGDPAATLAHTDATPFYRSSTGVIQTDPTYTQTNQALAYYRAKLKLRSTGSKGPPPYAKCP